MSKFSIFNKDLGASAVSVFDFFAEFLSKRISHSHSKQAATAGACAGVLFLFLQGGVLMVAGLVVWVVVVFWVVELAQIKKMKAKNDHE